MNSIKHHGSGNGNGSSANPIERLVARTGLHPTWQAFIQHCRELQHGEIERLKIQDGLPVLAEVIREKIRFTT